jgi:hypothetical protein
MALKFQGIIGKTLQIIIVINKQIIDKIKYYNNIIIL